MQPHNGWTVFARNRDTAVPAEGNGDLQTLICVLVARPIRCSTLSNPVPWQKWMAAYLGYTLWMKTLFCNWPVMGHDTHTRKKRRMVELIQCTRIQIRKYNKRWPTQQNTVVKYCYKNTNVKICKTLKLLGNARWCKISSHSPLVVCQGEVDHCLITDVIPPNLAKSF